MPKSLTILLALAAVAVIAAAAAVIYRETRPTLEDRVVAAITPTEQEIVSNMKASLRNLVTAQEAYFADSVRYSPTVSLRLQGLFLGTFGEPIAKPGVTVEIERAGMDGWQARAHSVGTKQTCVIFIGPIAQYQPVPAAKEGEPRCMS